jgi:hypothetical protein
MTEHSHPNTPSQLVNAADFAARDEHIRRLSYGVVRKLAGLPQDLFANYWRDVLGPLCARLPGILGSDDSSFVTGIELFADGGRAQV